MSSAVRHRPRRTRSASAVARAVPLPSSSVGDGLAPAPRRRLGERLAEHARAGAPSPSAGFDRFSRIVVAARARPARRRGRRRRAARTARPSAPARSAPVAVDSSAHARPRAGRTASVTPSTPASVSSRWARLARIVASAPSQVGLVAQGRERAALRDGFVFRRVSAALSCRQPRMRARGPARKPIRAPAMPKQCETENVATACSPAGDGAEQRARRVDRQRPVGDVVDEQQPVALGERGRARRPRRRAASGAVGVDRVDEADRPRARRDRRGHRVGVEADSRCSGPSGDGTGPPPAAMTADGRWK